jgi:arylsulfatase A-like enzyme
MVGFRGGLPIKSPTLPQRLVDHGYATAIVGRYMHQDPYEESYGYQTRILGSTYIENDEYAHWLEKQAPESGGVRGHGISFNGWAAKPWHLPEPLHPTNWAVNRARRLLAETSDASPLFLTVSFYAPHPPLIPPAFYLEPVPPGASP